MSRRPDISDQVLGFIQQYVPIVEAMEVLLFLHRRPEKQWTLEDITGETRASRAIAADSLSGYGSHGLVAEKESFFQYAPASPDLARAVDALAKAYAERPVSVIRAIYAPPESKIKSFADAFKVRKEQP